MSKLEGIVHGLAEDTYHAHPALSSTQARQILDTPARYHYAQSHPQAHKAAFDLGTSVHTKVLGVGSPAIGYPEEHLTDSGTVSTKAATREWEEKQRKAGVIVLPAKQLALMDGMAEAVLAHPVAKALLEQSGSPEASVFATDPATGVDMRARFDYLPDFTVNNPWPVDLKTTGKSAAPSEFLKTVANFGYHIQQEWYLEALRLATGEFNPRMKFIVVETSAPHLVAVHELSEQFAEIGAAQAKRARETYAECVESGVWPGYPNNIDPLQPPMWAIYAEEELA